MYTLVSFATYWGSKYGGINAFNTDFLGAFARDFQGNVQVICLVTSADAQDIDKAKDVNVTLVTLPYIPQDKIFAKDQAQTAIHELKTRGINFEPENTIWLGHDRISGEAAVAAAKLAGGRSALIHHMSYEAYEGFAENSLTANKKTQNQKRLFEQADVLLAVGPLLHEALAELLDKDSKDIHCLIPGLAGIEPRKTAPTKFRAFLSGRLSDDAKKIKQGHLGIAGFGLAIKIAHQQNSPRMLTHEPQMILRGVDFESKQNYAQDSITSIENDWQQFAENYSEKRINLWTLPYTQDRDQLYDELKKSSVALMPSWHEGFGLVAWEAIAAGVPLIVSKNSGVCRLLDQKYQDGLVKVIDINGKTQAPFFTDNDLDAVAKAIKAIADDVENARGRAAELRSRLAGYTWFACVAEAARHFAWNLPPNQSDLPSSPVETTPSPAPFQPANNPDSPLVMPGKCWQQGLPESRLLWADEAVVPFESGSSTFLADMQAWLDDPQWPQAIRLVWGAGGTGKTRLSLELCQQRLLAGWYCGFWSSQEAANPADFWKSLLSRNQPLLIVIDYAETRQSALLALIKAILQQPSTQAVRLLLLARTGGEWWDNLPSKDRDCELFLGGYAASVYSLPCLYGEAEQRLASYQRAVVAYAQKLNLPLPTIKPDLSVDHFAKPLYLQMAALLALLGEHPATAEGLTKALLNHERRYWAKALADCQLPEPEKLAQHLLGLVTLAGGFTTAKAAWPYWQTASDTLLDGVKFTLLFNALAPLYPHRDKQGLQPVQPDLLGEALVAQILGQTSGQTLLEAVLLKSELQHACLTVLARLVTHRPNLNVILHDVLKRHFVPCCQTITKVAVETPGSLTQLACEAFIQLPEKDKSQASGLLNGMLRDESVELAQLDYAVSAYEVEKSAKKLAKLGKHAKNSLRLEHANNLNNLSIAMSRVGGLESLAFEHAKEAVAICRLLVKQHKSVDFDEIHANCLNTYASSLSAPGESDEALTAAKQALEIMERLAKKNSDRFEPRYAGLLNNFANSLSNLGKTDEALTTAKQALEIRERLAKKNSDWFEPDYAKSLSNYANHLSDLGQTDEALTTAKQALEIRERLAKKNSDRFEPNYASSLINYANFLSDLGQIDEALTAARQALAIMERLAKKNSDRFEPDFATSLSNYANRLSELGQTGEALTAEKQALAIMERLAAKNSDWFEPNYASSLHNYAIFLSDLGQTDEALTAAKQALEISERLAKKILTGLSRIMQAR